MAQQPGLDVLRRERLAQQWIGLQVDLPDRQVVVRPPPGVQLLDLLGGRMGERRVGDHGHRTDPLVDVCR
jgi:hypothetical protein